MTYPDLQAGVPPAQAFDLHGRVAIVTGAGSGIGRASAEVLAAAGATVVCADVNAVTAKETAAAIEARGGSARSVALDVSHRAEVAEVVRTTVGDHGRLDVMCNIAGIIKTAAILETPEEDFDAVLAVNLKGVLFGCQEAAAVMVKAGQGSIVNMASGAIDAPRPELMTYGVAKVGVVQITKILAHEVGPSGVRVNAIAPGFVETGMTGRHWLNPDGSVDEERREAAVAPMRRMAPLGVVGAPADIAYAVLYLASDAARFVTGQILRPNGGVSMPW